MKNLTPVALLLAGLMSAGSAHAISVSSQFFPGGNLLSDNSAEYLIKAAANDNPANATILEVGDRLRGIFNVETVEEVPGGGPANNLGVAGVNELTGIFEIVVGNIVTNGQFLYPGGVTPCNNTYCFTFNPSASFATEMENFGFTNTVGAMVAFFEDDSPDFNRSITGVNAIANMEATATDGNPFWLAGFEQTFDFFTTNAQSNNIGISSILPFTTPFGQFALGLSLLDNPTGPNLGLVSAANVYAALPNFTGLTNFSGNGQLLAKGPAGPGGFSTAYDSLDDVNFAINVIPEPATLALLGMGLVGVGAFSRRRKV